MVYMAWNSRGSAWATNVPFLLELRSMCGNSEYYREQRKKTTLMFGGVGVSGCWGVGQVRGVVGSRMVLSVIISLVDANCSPG